jgi:hypothetical protein
MGQMKTSPTHLFLLYFFHVNFREADSCRANFACKGDSAGPLNSSFPKPVSSPLTILARQLRIYQVS